VTWLVLVVRIDTWQRGSTRVSRSREWDCVMLHCRLPVAYNRLLVLHCIALHCIVLHRSLGLGGFLLLNSHLPSWLLMLAVPLEEGDLRSWSGDLGPEIFALYGKRQPRQSKKRLVSCVCSLFQNSDKILARRRSQHVPVRMIVLVSLFALA
jgi:hypothetical protein